MSVAKTRKLEVLPHREAELEMCGYCPKLCRSVCPVSEAESREVLIPWGKMSIHWYAGRGELEPSQEVAGLAYACTGCLRCSEWCEHRNPVAETLLDARAEWRTRGVEPARATRVRNHFERSHDALRLRARAFASDEAAKHALLLGCGYLSGKGAIASDAHAVVTALVGTPRVLTGCCGLRFRSTGDVARAASERESLLAELGGRRLLVHDAGCALELASQTKLTPVTLAELGAEHLARFEPRFEPRAGHPREVRYHDPCRLARGLGVTEQPRRVLERALGRKPAEFEYRERQTRCSGAGGVLPFTMPENARVIARARLDEHDRLGGGTLVTACAGSRSWFAAQGADVEDLATIMARSVNSG
jgi:Fe-S oxidoreductase